MNSEADISEVKLNQKQAAELLGINRYMLTRKGKEAPRNEDGTYNPMKIVAWYLKKFKRGTEGMIEEERFRKIKRENDQEESNLIDMEVIKPHCELLLSSLQRLSDQFGQKVTITGQQAQKELNDTLKRVAEKIRPIKPEPKQ